MWTQEEMAELGCAGLRRLGGAQCSSGRGGPEEATLEPPPIPRTLAQPHSLFCATPTWANTDLNFSEGTPPLTSHLLLD